VKTIQVVLEKDLLEAADRAARKLKISRSALFRDALREHLKRFDAAEREKRDRDGYERHPDVLDRPAVWDAVRAWPDR
jgi:metal-responsive CopG/Arc/MetJ family transcriptional regulator